MAADEHKLVFDGVTKTFDDSCVVEDVTVTVGAGERVALVGPSGAGKTTVLRLANGSLQPDEGTVRFDGDTATSEQVALAYQGETLVDRRTALANVISGRVGALSWWRGLLEPLSPRNPEPALALLDAVGLADRADDRVDALSAGERQRVAFARALIQEAPVVLADEPTANLDPASRETVLSVLDAVAGDRTLLTVLHDVDLALDHYDRILGLAAGRLQFDAPASEVSEEMLDSLFGGSDSSQRAASGARAGVAQSAGSERVGDEAPSHRGVPWDV